MADSDQVDVLFIEEVTPGVTPATPALQQLRTTSPAISLDPQTVESGEIRADRMMADVPLVGLNVGGEVGLEMSFGNADKLIAAGFCSDWVNVAQLTASGATTSTTYTVASGGAAFKKGMVVRGVGFTNAANNGQSVLAADATATTITVPGPLTVETPPAGAYIKAVGFQAAVGDMAAAVSPNRLTITGTSGDFTGHGLLPGDWIKIGGTSAANQFATAACNGYARILSVTATTLTFDIVPSGFAADAGASKNIRISYADRLAHGTQRRYFTVQRQFQDQSPVGYETSRGQEVGQFRMSWPSQNIITAGVTFMGLTGDTGTTQISGATEIAATTGDIMTTAADMGVPIIDGLPQGATDKSFVQSIDFTLNNNMRNKTGVGIFGAAGHGLGRIAMEGTVTVYFENTTLYNKAISNTDTQVAVKAIEPGGKRGFLLDLPALKCSGAPSVSGPNTDIMLALRYRARRHPTLGYMARMFRYFEIL